MDLTFNSLLLTDFIEALNEQQEADMKFKRSLGAFLENLKAEDWVTIDEACATTGKDKRSIRYLAETGQIETKRISDRKTLYRLSDVVRFIPREKGVSKDLENACLSVCQHDDNEDWIPPEFASAFTGVSQKRLKVLASSGIIGVRMLDEGKILYCLQDVMGKARALLNAE